MLAARLHRPGEPLRLEEIALPVPSGTQVRVRVAGCGVCRTDLHVVDGTQSRVDLPRVLGHEVAGWVDREGPDAGAALEAAGLRPGDPVVVYGGWGCGRCRECHGGTSQRCPDSIAPGFQADGGYAEAMLVPDATVLEPLGGLDPRDAGPLADAGMTALRAVERAARWLTPGAEVIVIGAGGVGQFLVQLLRLAPAGPDLHIVVVEPNHRRALRAEQLGADEAISHADLPPRAAGSSAIVFDLVGGNDTLAAATRLVGPGGAVVLVGEAGGSLRFGFDGIPVEAWLTTVAWGSRDDLRAVVRFAIDRRIQWHAEHVPLRRVAEAHERLRAGEVDGRLILVP